MRQILSKEKKNTFNSKTFESIILKFYILKISKIQDNFIPI